MAWTTPVDVITGELVTASKWNTEINDNLDFLKAETDALRAPPATMTSMTTARSTTSASFVDLTDATATIVTAGGDVLALFMGTFFNSTSANTRLQFDQDASVSGQLVSQDMTGASAANDGVQIVMQYRWEGLSAASHTIKVQWLTTAGTVNHDANNSEGTLILAEVT